MTARCVCGCGQRAPLRHHCVYRQELRRLGGNLKDPRNLVDINHRCHERHHCRVAVLPLAVLPDSVFEFALELMGAGPAYEYLRRRYQGEDARLDGLLAKV